MLCVLSAAIAVAAPPLSSFHTERVVEGITVSVARPPGAMTWGQAEALVAASPEAVLAHLTDFERLPRAVPRLDRIKVLERVPAGEGSGEAVVYFHLDLPWPISDREYTVRYRWRHEEGGAIEVLVDDANALGPPAKAVRVTAMHGQFLLAQEGEATRVRYLFTADFGGLLPRSVKEETVWKQPLETLRGIRKALVGR